MYFIRVTKMTRNKITAFLKKLGNEQLYATNSQTNMQTWFSAFRRRTSLRL